jgi:hypothetical protein
MRVVSVVSMNEEGHTPTLVAAHPGNRNAVKSGVFSPASLAPRVQELDIAIRERPSHDVALELLGRELAALSALGEAMDNSLASDGVEGRRGQPRSLINLRLRLNGKLLQTLNRYVEVDAAVPYGSAAEGDTASADDGRSLTDAIAYEHARVSIATIEPQELDPEQYLTAVIMSTDPVVTTQDRLRARKMLTTWSTRRSPKCVCVSTLMARDALELRGWIDECRERGKPSRNDRTIAAVARRLAAGEQLEPWAFFRRSSDAMRDVLADGLARARDSAPREGSPTDAIDPVHAPFWTIALSPDSSVAAKERLDAIKVLDEAGALPTCSCRREPKDLLAEDERDITIAYTIRLVAQRHYRAASLIARFPESYLAVRDAIDAQIVGDLAVSESAIEKA